MHKVNPPATDCVRCHGKGFVNPLYMCSADRGKGCEPTAVPDPCVAPGKGTCMAADFCSIVANTFTPNAPVDNFGSMARKFTDGAECHTFAKDMNCDAAQIGCPATTTTTTTTATTTTT
jgi:hypothetical protein